MNFDVVIIGGGLAGLTCGIALQQQGKHCAIINNGQAAIDFSSGSMDLLSRLPSGQIVAHFCESYADLAAQLPTHPYCILGKQQVQQKAEQFEQLATDLNLGLIGSHTQNHFRVTPLGALRGSWLSPNSVPTLDLGQTFPFTRIAVLGIEGYHDFQPQLLAANLVENQAFRHCQVTTGFLNIPELDQLRDNAREFRSVNIAQLLAHKLAFRDLVAEIKTATQNAEAIFLPACFGLDDQGFFQQLKQAVGLAMFELPTLPPSLLGIRQHHQLRQRFEQLGGLSLNGDRAMRAEIEQQRVTKIYTQRHQENAISAQHFVLASGSFFSNGLIAEFEHIIEPLFHADITGCKPFSATDRLSWTANRFAAAQPYQSAGVIINAQCQVSKGGQFVPNLYAAGNIIGGYNGIELGCGSGVAVITALTVAEQILKDEI